MSSTRGIHVLGIESSCDDTGVAIVNQDGKILSNCIHSQLEQHLNHGGIIPVVAKEYHLSNIDSVARQAMKESNLDSVQRDIDAIAVSNRPGLKFSLQVGLNYARKLAKKYSKPLIPIHHMQAHSLMPLLQHRSIRFPYITLLISGGHCLLAIAKRYNEFEILGESKDDAPGDLLDKFARRFKLRNLGHPFDTICGGAAVELLARREGADRFKYFNSDDVPMMRQNNCDFSFTGYKKACDDYGPVMDDLWLSGEREKLISELSHMSASLQRVILIQLVKKLQRAFYYYRVNWRYFNQGMFASKDNSEHLGFKLHNLENESSSVDIVVSGGVAANSYLMETMRTMCNECIDDHIRLYHPTKELCSDNGLMIAWNGMLRYRDYLKGKNDYSILDVDNSVILDSKLMDRVDVATSSPMGINIGDRIRKVGIKLPRFSHPELRNTVV